MHVATAIASIRPFPTTILEIGAGDGTFMLRVARRLRSVSCSQVKVLLLDMQPVVEEFTLQQFRGLGWGAEVIRQNVEEWLRSANPARADLVVANLFLHHFKEDFLRRFFAELHPLTNAMVACEPRRWRPALLGSRLLGLIGCNHVTRHDAIVSVRAGFRDQDLTRLWPRSAPFELHEYPAGLASHLFVATRKARK